MIYIYSWSSQNGGKKISLFVRTAMSISDERKPKFVWWRELLSASTPSLAWSLVGTPFNVITVRLQTTSKKEYRSAWHCLRTTLSEEGILALWKGFTPALLGSIPYSTCLFGTFAYLRPPKLSSLKKDGEIQIPLKTMINHYTQIFTAGFVSGILLTLLQNPIDVWRTRLQVQKKTASSSPSLLPGRGTGGTTSPMVSQGVLQSLITEPKLATRGLAMTATRQMPGNGFFFTIHEFLSMQAEVYSSSYESHPTLSRLCVGGLTGILFNLIFFPFDVIKARMMVTTSSAGGPIQISRALLQEAGWRGFYRGLEVVLLRAFPVNAFGFLALQTSQDLLSSSTKE